SPTEAIQSAVDKSRDCTERLRPFNCLACATGLALPRFGWARIALRASPIQGFAPLAASSSARCPFWGPPFRGAAFLGASGPLGKSSVMGPRCFFTGFGRLVSGTDLHAERPSPSGKTGRRGTARASLRSGSPLAPRAPARPRETALEPRAAAGP